MKAQHNSKSPQPKNWDENHRIYPTTNADIAYAEWTWNNFPEPITYPDGFPSLEVYNNRLRVYKGVFDNDALVFTVPVERIPANSELALTIAVRGGSWMPAYWTAEACLNGTDWVEMDVLGINKEGITYASYEDRDGATKTAPMFITKKDSEHVYLATLPVKTEVTKKVVQIRVRVLLAKGISGTLNTSPANNSNNNVAFAEYTIDNTTYPGPCVFIKTE